MSDEERFDELLAQDWPEPAEEDVRLLHEAVLSRVRRQTVRRRRLVWCTAGAAAAVVAFCVVQIGRTPQISQVAEDRPPVLAAVHPLLSLPVLPAAAPVRFTRQAHRRPAPGLRSVALITPPDGPPMIKLTTSDPNVVILLQSDGAPSTERTQSNE